MFNNNGENGAPATLLGTSSIVVLNNFPTDSEYSIGGQDAYLQEAWLNFNPPISVNSNFTFVVEPSSTTVEFPIFLKPTAGAKSYNDFWTNSGGTWNLKKKNVGQSRLGLTLFQDSETSVPAVINQIVDLSQVAEGSSLQLSAQFSGNALEYRWYKDGQLLAGQIRSTLQFVDIDNDDLGKYRVEASNDKGTISSAEGEVKIAENAPKIVTQQGSGGFISLGDMARFSVSASGQNLTYQWKRNGEEIQGADESSYSFRVEEGDYSASFQVMVSNSSGSATANFNIRRLTTYQNLFCLKVHMLRGMDSVFAYKA